MIAVYLNDAYEEPDYVPTDNSLKKQQSLIFSKTLSEFSLFSTQDEIGKHV